MLSGCDDECRHPHGIDYDRITSLEIVDFPIVGKSGTTSDERRRAALTQWLVDHPCGWGPLFHTHPAGGIAVRAPEFSLYLYRDNIYLFAEGGASVRSVSETEREAFLDVLRGDP